jgi:hypothetical protein
MTEADIKIFGSLSKEVENIQNALKLLGYEVQGLRRNRKNPFYRVLNLRFVGPSFFSGDKFSPPLAPSKGKSICKSNFLRAFESSTRNS